MFPMTHHHVETSDHEKGREIARLIGRVVFDLAAFAAVGAVLWWIMVKV